MLCVLLLSPILAIWEVATSVHSRYSMVRLFSVCLSRARCHCLCCRRGTGLLSLQPPDRPGAIGPTRPPHLASYLSAQTPTCRPTSMPPAREKPSCRPPGTPPGSSCSERLSSGVNDPLGWCSEPWRPCARRESSIWGHMRGRATGQLGMTTCSQAGRGEGRWEELQPSLLLPPTEPGWHPD